MCVFSVCRLVQTLSTALHRGGRLGGGDRSDGLLSLGALHLLLCFLKRFLGLHPAFGAALPGEWHRNLVFFLNYALIFYLPNINLIRPRLVIKKNKGISHQHLAASFYKNITAALNKEQTLISGVIYEIILQLLTVLLTNTKTAFGN